MKSGKRRKRRKGDGLNVELGHKVKSLMTVILTKMGSYRTILHFTKPTPFWRRFFLCIIQIKPQPEINRPKGGY